MDEDARFKYEHPVLWLALVGVKYSQGWKHLNPDCVASNMLGVLYILSD